jgi:hypothetical protein
MRRRYKYGFWSGFDFPPHGFRFWRPWGGRAWGLGFPRREDYLRLLEEYKEELEEMQRQIADELKDLEREIEELKQK